MTGIAGSIALSTITKRIRTVAVLAAIAVAPLALSGCVDEQGARTVAQAYGFTDVVTSRPSTFYNGCSERDHYATAIEATNPQGARISGVVCAGGWGGKMGTLRIDEIIRPAPLQPVAEPVLRTLDSGVPLAQ